MKKLYTSENKVLLYLLKSKLEQQGIQTFLKNEYPPLAGEIPPILAWPELWIMDDENIGRAQKIIQTEISDNTDQSSWQCPKCDELLEGQFEFCWKCGE